MVKENVMISVTYQIKKNRELTFFLIDLLKSLVDLSPIVNFSKMKKYICIGTCFVKKVSERDYS